MIDHLGFCFDLRGMVESDAGDGKQQHAGQAQCGTDPVPLAQGAKPEGMRHRRVVSVRLDIWDGDSSEFLMLSMIIYKQYTFLLGCSVSDYLQVCPMRARTALRASRHADAPLSFGA